MGDATIWSMTKMGNVPPKCCLNCHFMMADEDGYPVPETKRREWRGMLTGNTKIMTETDLPREILGQFRCFKGVWCKRSQVQDAKQEMYKAADASQGIPDLSWRPSQLIEDRGDRCFFYPHTDRLSMEAANELERREAGRREAEKDRKLTRYAFYVAFAALVASSMVGAANLGWSFITGIIRASWTVWANFHPFTR